MKLSYLTAISAVLVLLSACTDMTTIAADPVADDDGLLAAEGHWRADARTYEFERALTLAARRER